MKNYHNFDKINNKKSLKIRDFVDFIGVNDHVIAKKWKQVID